MITVLIPVASYPSFVPINVRNIQATCGLSPGEYDICFLTEQDCSPELESALDAHAKANYVRRIRAPFNSRPSQLALIDWAVRHQNLSEWVFLQHCDTFWMNACGWLALIRDFIAARPHPRVVTLDHFRDGGPFLLDGKPTFTLHDFIAVHNVCFLREHDLRFQWGIPGRDISLSPQAIELIHSGRLRWAKIKDSRATPPTTRISPGKDWLDGSQAMNIECLARFDDRVAEIHCGSEFYNHPWQFFRIGDGLGKQPDVLFVPELDKQFDKTLIYSAITSLLFDTDGIEDRILPWAVMNRLAAERGASTAKALDLVHRLKPYAHDMSPLGPDNDLAIKGIRCGQKLYGCDWRDVKRRSTLL